MADDSVHSAGVSVCKGFHNRNATDWLVSATGIYMLTNPEAQGPGLGGFPEASPAACTWPPPLPLHVVSTLCVLIISFCKDTLQMG